MVAPTSHVQIYKVRCRVLVETTDRRWLDRDFLMTDIDPVSIKKYIWLYFDDYAIVIDYHILDITPVNNEP